MYRYRDVPIDRVGYKLVVQLILSQDPEKTVESGRLMRMAVQFHESQGGIFGLHGVGPIEEAIRDLVKEGVLERPARGYIRLSAKALSLSDSRDQLRLTSDQTV